MPAEPLHHRSYELPISLTRFIGREQEIAAVSELLRRDDVRLATLTGPGGVGKTRLAGEVARSLASEFPDGAVFVDLAPLRDPDFVLMAIVKSLDLQDAGDQPLADKLRSFVNEKQLLMVLDNFEHVTAAATFVVDLLASCPNLKVLVTSRAPLGVSVEHQYEVPPLTLPEQGWRPSAQGLSEFEATRLFVDRAQSIKRDFAVTDENARTIADICQRLDGLPLAVLLAAGWVKTLTPAALLAELQPRLPRLTHGARDAPARHQTMRNAIAWSYDLLPLAEQAMFRKLAVFAGGFTIDAAKSVAVPDEDADIDLLDLLHSLVDKSLLRLVKTQDGEPRYAMLGTIREFGLEQLSNNDEMLAARERHALHCLGWVMWINAGHSRSDEPNRLDWIDAELADISLAFAWLMEQEAVNSAGALLLSLGRFWEMRGRYRTRRSWLDRILAASVALRPGLRMLALRDALRLASIEDNVDELLKYSAEVLTALEGQIAETGWVVEGPKLDPSTAKTLSSEALSILSAGHFQQNDLGRAIGLVERSLDVCRRLPISGPESTDALLAHLSVLSSLWEQHGDYERADAALREALGLAQEAGSDWGIGKTISLRANLAQLKGDDRQALSLYKEGLPFLRKAKSESELGANLLLQASLMTTMEQHAEAAPLLREAQDLAQDRKYRVLAADVHMALAWVAEAQDDPQGAISQYERSLELRRQLEDPSAQGVALCVCGLADNYRAVGEYHRAMGLYGEQLVICKELELKSTVANALDGMGLTCLAKGDQQEAAELCEQALAVWEEIGDVTGQGRALCSLADIALRQGHFDRALTLFRQGIAKPLAAAERRGIGVSAIRLASLEVASGDLGRAARVLGMLAALRETTALSLTAANIEEFDRLLATVRSKLGQKASDMLLDEGRALLDLAQGDADRNETYDTIRTALEKPTKRSDRPHPSGLTERQLEVLQLLIQGMTDQQIADALYRSPKTVSTHLSAIYGKLGVTSRAQAIAHARDHNLV
jgi:predicted ATPase/DNA-binding CsgD family transcriptional regulator